MAAVILCGGQWAALQVVAWTSMAVSYSSEYGLREGLTKTFDGSTPCAMCKKITKSKSEEDGKSKALSTKVAKVEAVTENDNLLGVDGFAPVRVEYVVENRERAASRSERPLLMPPRSV